MKLEELTPEIVTPVIEAVVAEYGEDYRYEAPGGGSCVYLHEGEPSCIVGQVMSRLGVDITGWDDESWPGYASIANKVLDTTTSTLPPVHRALHYAQSDQDTGATWGAALEAYQTTLYSAGQ